jgi:hypothetical protein
MTAILQPAILCDIDGTLAHMRGRSPYDWGRVEEDFVDENVREILELYHYNTEVRIILLSGRDDVCRKETIRWLDHHLVSYDELLMRSNGDNRKDNIVKAELFNEFVKDRYKVRFILDDRDQVVKMWREELGLTCFQVAPGDF